MASEDEKIWQAYTKGVKPAQKRAVSFRKTLSSAGGARRNKVDPESHLVFQPKENGIPGSRKGAPRNDTVHNFAKSLEKQMRAGTIEIDGRIDLHGMTQAEAYDALARFIARQVKMAHRNLLIITGKGKENKGVLRTNLPGWLESLPEAAQVLGMHKAAIPHGGDGAFYVILRRRRVTDG